MKLKVRDMGHLGVRANHPVISSHTDCSRECGQQTTLSLGYSGLYSLWGSGKNCCCRLTRNSQTFPKLLAWPDVVGTWRRPLYAHWWPCIRQCETGRRWKLWSVSWPQQHCVLWRGWSNIDTTCARSRNNLAPLRLLIALCQQTPGQAVTDLLLAHVAISTGISVTKRSIRKTPIIWYHDAVHLEGSVASK